MRGLFNKFREFLGNFRNAHVISELEKKYVYTLEDALSVFSGIIWTEDTPDDSCSGIAIIQEGLSGRFHSCYFDFRKTLDDRPVWIMHTDYFSDSNYVLFDKYGLFEWTDSCKHKFFVKKFGFSENFT